MNPKVLFLSLLGRSFAYINNPQQPDPNPSQPLRAWMCSGKTNAELVGKLASAGIVKSPVVKRALLAVDRRDYVPGSMSASAYQDNPIPIGRGQTISAPHMHAHCIEDLLPSLKRASERNPDEPLRVLDVGLGSGFLTAAFGRLIQAKSDELKAGAVYGIDVIPELVEAARSNMLKRDGDLLDSGIVTLDVADGWHGYPRGSPYHAIHVGAAAATLPTDLMLQLAVGGTMVIPVGPDGGTQYLYQVERVGNRGGVVGTDDDAKVKGYREEDYQMRRVLGVRYVPLVRKD